MENQHRMIAGYRELSAEEIRLMNQIKAQGRELISMCNELEYRLNADLEAKRHAAEKAQATTNFDIIWKGASAESFEFRRFSEAQPLRWVAIGKTDIQTGIMALVRAIAQPQGV